MLRQVKLKNFRRHEDRTINFASGLNIMKAPNEGGKSSVIESVLYALFGATSLRNSLADTVTWGKKETELKVELLIEVGGRLFKFVRGKSGAECHHDGGIVTGQKEVSAFASEILGGDEKTMSRLMLASQSNMRGALEEGPKAVSTIIEGLADFDLFERLAEAASVKLLSGSSVLLASKLADAEAALASVSVGSLDLSSFDERTAALNTSVAATHREIEVAEPRKLEAKAALEKAESQQQMRDMAERNLKKATDDLALNIEHLKLAQEKAKKIPLQSELDALKAELASVEQLEVTKTAYAGFTALTYPKAFWEGDRASLDSEVDKTETLLTTRTAHAHELSTQSVELTNSIQRLQSQIITSTCCPTCKQELQNKAEIERRNAEIESDVRTAQISLGVLKTKLAEAAALVDSARVDLNTLKAIVKVSQPFDRFATQHGQYLAVDCSFVPPKLAWNATKPEENTLDAEEIRKRIISWESAKDAAERANGRSITLAEAIESGKESIERLQRELDGCAAPGDYKALAKVASDAACHVLILRDDLIKFQRELQEVELGRQQAVSDHQAALNRKEEAEKVVVQARKDLDVLHFNNNLLAKIRKARPVISDSLWNTVLASVSSMFTQMRGEQSVVMKTKDGFTVNGEAVASLSGSTLDLLGLAIRVALVKTFLPHISLLILDEPGAAMDSERITKMLGFIVSLGMDQVLFVTHDEMSEGFADNLVCL